MNTKRRTGKLLSVLLCLVLLLGLLPTAAQAEEGTAAGVSILKASGTISLSATKPYIQTNASTDSSAEPGTGGSYVAYFNRATGTLYLNNFQYKVEYSGGTTVNGIGVSTGHLTINLTGTNSFTVSTQTVGNYKCIGIYAKELTITGSGSLTVNSTTSNGGMAYGIYVKNDLTVDSNAAVYIGAATSNGDTSRSAHGFYAEQGDITLNGRSMSAAVSSTGTAYGVSADQGAVSIGGKLTVDLQSQGMGIVAEDNSNTTTPAITLDGGDVTITGKAKYGLFDVSAARSEGTAGISIRSSTLTMTAVTGVEAGIRSSNSGLAISDSTVTVNVESGGPVAINKAMSVEDSEVLLATGSNDRQAVSAPGAAVHTIDLSGSGTVTAKTKQTSVDYPIQGKVSIAVGTRCTAGTYNENIKNYMAAAADADGCRVVKFEHYETVPAAAVGDVTVSGGQGREITPAEVRVTLTDCVFADDLGGSGDWIINLPAGLSQSVTRVSDTEATITVSGTPTNRSSAAIHVTVPQAAIKNGAENVVAAANENARFDIKGAYKLTLVNCTATVDGVTVESGSSVVAGTEVTVTATLTGNYKLNYWSITDYGSPPKENTVTFTMPGRDVTAEPILYDDSKVVAQAKVPIKYIRSASTFGDIKLEDINESEAKNENTELAIVWYNESGTQVSAEDAIDRSKNYRGHITVTCTGDYVFKENSTVGRYVITLYTEIHNTTSLDKEQYTISADKKKLEFDVYLVNLPQVTIPLYRGEELPTVSDCTVSAGCTVKNLAWSTTGTVETSATISELKIERAKGTLWGTDSVKLSVNNSDPQTVTDSGTYLTLSNVTLTASERPTGVTVSGTVKSYGDASETVTVTLLQGASVIGSPQVLTGASGSVPYSQNYSFPAVPAGTYTLKVEKKGHAPWTEEITVATTAIAKDVTVYLWGDVNRDGEVTAADAQEIQRKAAGLSSVFGTDPNPAYCMLRADVNGDNQITAADAQEIQRKAAGLSSAISNLP